MKNKNILVAAGGTGGHLFPAVAVVEELEKSGFKKEQIFFVGNPDKIEGRIVPSLGYNFLPLDISGISKIFSFSTLLLPFKIINSIKKVKNYIKRHNIGMAICTGAYLSYPVGLAAKKCKIPLILMESNVFPGKTIKLLSKKADLIALAYEEGLKYFDNSIHNKIKILGNPVRNNLSVLRDKIEARKSLNLEENKFTILVFGGSLGAKSINTAVENLILKEKFDFQFIWQTGKTYQTKIDKASVRTFQFIDDMASAYSASDLVICRAGATTISELCTVRKPSILIPYPFSANNHQEYNAKMMVQNGASIMIKDDELDTRLETELLHLSRNHELLKSMSDNAGKLFKNNSAESTAKEIMELFAEVGKINA